MATRTSNWTQFKWPFAPLDTFTRSEPFPSNELKATYVDGMHRPRKNDVKQSLRALKKRWSKIR